MKPTYLAVALSLTFTGCAQQHIHPPEKVSLHNLKNQVSQPNYTPNESAPLNQKISSLYLMAQKHVSESNIARACSNWRELATYSQFPLQQIVLANRLTYCSHEIDQETASNIRLNQNDWSYNAMSEALYQYHKTKNNTDQFIEVALEYLPLIKNHQKQIDEFDYVKQKAIEIKRYVDRVTELESKLFARRIPTPGPEQYYEVARSFEKVREFEKAREYYQKILKNEKVEFANRLKAMQRHALTHKLERDKEKYAHDLNSFSKYIYKLLTKQTSNQDIRNAYFEIKIDYARALWTIEQTSEAKKVLKKLINFKTDEKDYYAKIYWLLALMEVESKNYVIASNLFLKATGFEIKDEEILSNVYWDTLWNYYLQKKDEQVILFYKKIIAKIDNEYLKDKINFWAAKSLKNLNRTKEAYEIFSDLITNKPYTYYGIISHKEVGSPIPPLKVHNLIKTSELPKTLQWLISFNLKDEKKAFLKSYLEKSHLELEEKLVFYHLSESHALAFQLFFEQDIATRNELFHKYPQLIFPIPIEEELTSIPEGLQEVENELILSITRQESSFDPMARSWADAFGLMQLLPLKSKLLAEKYSIPYKNFFDLYDSKVNILIGSALLKELKTTFDNKFINYVAAYNAGGGPVRKWTKSRFVDSPLRDIEMIPYEETRGYVKLVLRNFLIYKRMQAQHPFNFPKLN